jgi:uncharacterized protein (TIGR02118 family)
VVKIIVLYGHPTDPAAFDEHYEGVHAPLVEKMPGLKLFEVSRVVGTAEGGDLPYYRIAELSFENQEAHQAALGSPEGQETVADLPNFASGGATVLFAEVE